ITQLQANRCCAPNGVAWCERVMPHPRSRIGPKCEYPGRTRWVRWIGRARGGMQEKDALCFEQGALLRRAPEELAVAQAQRIDLIRAEKDHPIAKGGRPRLIRATPSGRVKLPEERAVALTEGKDAGVRRAEIDNS